MPEVKLMTPLFDGGMYNRTGRRMRAVFIKEVSDGATTYRLWRKDGKPEIEYPRCDNDRYILHVEVNSYLIPLRMTEFQMIDNCGYLPAVNELYGSKEGRVAFFNELRERDGWNQPTSVSEAMKREEEAVTRLGSQPERWVASISKQLASHVKFYLQSEKNGGLTHPDYVGACVLNKLDECMKLSEAHQEYIQKEKEKIAAEEAEKRHREAEEINAKAKQEIEAAVKIIREGGRLNNDRIDYRVGDVGHNEPIVLFLMRRYKVGVPLRTQGWICSKLANVTIKDGRCDGLQYYKAKGAACSQRFFDCMNELVQKVIQEEEMITMENTRELIDFEYYGKSYRMAPDEIEAAYRYQEMQYRKADALRMLTSYAFGIEDLDTVSDEDRAEYEKEFETSYGITFEEAKKSIPEIVSYFFQKIDCNVGENTTWYEAIEAVFGGNRDGD